MTDYSSVMFDFANTGKKIILYCYDAQDYINDRGMYMDYYSLPFTFAFTEEQLFNEIDSPFDYAPYESEMSRFVEYDNKNAAAEICSVLIDGERPDGVRLINGSEFSNGKENVLIFGGALMKNGITSALKNLINSIDKTKRNYFLLFIKNDIAKNKDVLGQLGEKVAYIIIHGDENLTSAQKNKKTMYYSSDMGAKLFQTRMKKIYETELNRVLPSIDFDYVIHYTGYERRIAQLFSVMSAKKSYGYTMI